MLQMRKEILCLPNELSEREKEVLTWTARGKTAWETASILNLSRRTVEWYIQQARLKLNSVTITQTVVEAMKHGYIVPLLTFKLVKLKGATALYHLAALSLLS